MCARTFGQPQQISKIFTFLFLFVASHCMETNFKQTQIISDNPDDPSCCPMQPCFNRWRHNDYKQITKKICKMSHCKWSSPPGESALHISLLLGTIWDMMWQKKEVQCAIVCSIYVPLRCVYAESIQKKPKLSWPLRSWITQWKVFIGCLNISHVANTFHMKYVTEPDY